MSEAEPGDLPVLHMFRSSHFNEKARWALDWKRVPHRRVTHLPGPHMLKIRRMTGQTATPVLELDDEVVFGSARIIDRLERRFGDAPLYPADPEARRQALEIQAHFDAEVGPCVRTALFSAMLPEPDFICATFARDRGALTRAVYRATFPLVRGVMARAHELDRPERVDRAFAVTRQALDDVAKRVGPSGQLVGDRFSVADLTCAALLAPLAGPDHPDMARPQPVPERVRELLARWADHEAIHWVRDQYARHRPAPAAV